MYKATRTNLPSVLGEALATARNATERTTLRKQVDNEAEHVREEWNGCIRPYRQKSNASSKIKHCVCASFSRFQQ